MPCTDARDDWDREHLARGTRLLCEALKKRLIVPEPSTELANWWEDHKNMDALYARKSAEMLERWKKETKW